MVQEVRIRLLGGFAVAVGDRPVAAGAWRLRKARSLLKLLCLAPGHRMHREQLYDLLWPGLDRTAAANNLHQVLHAARRALAATGAGDGVVVLRDDLVLLGPDGGVRVDVDELDAAVRRTRQDGAVSSYRAALALAEPGLLPEDTYEPWVGEAAAALALRRTSLRLGLAETLEREHRTEEAVEVLERLVAQDPLHEPGHRALMRSLARAGRRGEALAAYERLRDALHRETGGDPDPRTRGLYRSLLAGSVDTGEERPVTPAPARRPPPGGHPRRPEPPPRAQDMPQRDVPQRDVPQRDVPPQDLPPAQDPPPAHAQDLPPAQDLPAAHAQDLPPAQDLTPPQEPTPAQDLRGLSLPEDGPPSPSPPPSERAPSPPNPPRPEGRPPPSNPPFPEPAPPPRDRPPPESGPPLPGPPPPRDRPLPQHPRHNLPEPATGLIGRERETAEVERLLLRSRLLTLTGAGGCGKTRLALAVAARRAAALRDGAWFVDLAALTEAHLVPDAVAAVLGLQLPPSGAACEALAGQLAGRELLLVLDNCEHLVEACAALASEVMARCPDVTVLATSREPLRSYGERTFRVPSLALPDPCRLPPVEELGRYASVRLFTERAADAAPGFRLTPDNAAAVAQICFRLDGMPLALELAAARVHILTPRQIAERLDDAPALLGRGSRRGATRQETLLATLDWSHRLLDEDERRLFRRLAVFVGGFTLAAAEEVCADDAAGAPVLDLLGRLADKSLVWVEPVEPGQHEARYRLLEPVRQYAAGQLRAAGEEAAAEARHRRFYLELARTRDQEPPTGICGPTPLELEADYGNLRAALRSSLRGDPGSALRLAAALRFFWSERGRLAEGRRWLDDTLAAAPEPTPQRAAALMGKGVLAVRLGDGSPLEDIGAQIVAVHEQCGDRAALAHACCRQSMLLWMRGTREAAAAALDRARALAREADEPSVPAAVAYHEGVRAVCRGEGAAARAACTRSLGLLEEVKEGTAPFLLVMTPGYAVEDGPAGGEVSVFFEETVLVGRTVGAARARGHVLANLAWAARLEGDCGGAEDAAGRSVDTFRALADPYGESLALNTLGNVCRTRGDHDAARQYLEDALAVRRRLGDRREEGITLGCLGLLRLAAGDTGGARDTLAAVLAGYEETDDIPGSVNSLLHLGLVARAAGDRAGARALLTRARRLEHIAGSRHAAGWVALMLARLARQDGDPGAATAAAARAADLFDSLGDTRGRAALRRLREAPDRPPAPGGEAQSDC
ncbi:AfsR/SARP family transcriptional regulator [Streptomyces sp. NPDC003374]